MRSQTDGSGWRPWLLGWFGMLGLAPANGTLRAVVTRPLLGETAATAILLAALNLTAGRIRVLVPIWTAMLPAVVRRAQAVRQPAGVG